MGGRDGGGGGRVRGHRRPFFFDLPQCSLESLTDRL